MAIDFDYTVPVGVARVMDLAAQLGVLTVQDSMPEMRRDLANRIEDQADLLTRQELRALRHAAALVLEVVR